MKKICGNCPFRKDEGKVRLHKERAREIAENAASPDGVAFWCHKTTGRGQTKIHCQGSALLTLATIPNDLTQSLRIGVALGIFDPADRTDADKVFGSVEEMIEGHGF